MIRASNLTKTFGSHVAVDGISFEAAKGETLILLGTSGSGKTVTLKMLNKLIEPDSGEIEINGKNINSGKVEDLRRGIGYVIQNIGLFPHLTIEENIAVVPKLLKWDKERIKKRTEELLEKVNIPHQYLRQYPNQLSGGQQQRIGIARALIADPPVILMDEPFGALDAITRASIRASFKSLDELKDKTIVMVTHDIFEAFELGNRVCLFDKGKIQQCGTPAELLFHPANDFVKKFFDEQRFQLQLYVLTLADIIKYIHPLIHSSTNIHIQKPDTRLIDVMEILSNKKDGEAVIGIDAEPVLITGIEGIMAAYNHKTNEM